MCTVLCLESDVRGCFCCQHHPLLRYLHICLDLLIAHKQRQSTMSDDSYDAALDLLRRLNPQNISANLDKLIALQPTLAEDLLSTVDTPLTVIKDPETGKSFLACDYNRDLDSHRSPWSNVYVPALDDDDSPFPSKQLRDLEIKMNDAMDVYRDLYYEGGVSSVYLWDQEEGEGFAGVVLFKKSTEDKKAQWDSIHVFEVEMLGKQKASYKVTSTIILDLSTKDKAKNIGLAGNLVRQTEKEGDVDGEYGHIVNLGTLVEDIESKLRNLLAQVYFDKTRDIIGDVRSLSSLADVENDKKLHSQVVKGIQGL